MVTLLTSAARTASGTSLVTAARPETIRVALFQLSVTAAAALAADTLDVFLTASVDGVTFDDVLHFTQVLGNGGAKTYLATWLRDVTPTTALRAAAVATMAAGVRHGVFGSTWRIDWTIVDGGAHGQAFTFSVAAHLIR